MSTENKLQLIEDTREFLKTSKLTGADVPRYVEVHNWLATMEIELAIARDMATAVAGPEDKVDGSKELGQ